MSERGTGCSQSDPFFLFLLQVDGCILDASKASVSSISDFDTDYHTTKKAMNVSSGDGNGERISHSSMK